MKKYIISITIFALLLLNLSGCVSTGPDTSDTKDSTGTEGTEDSTETETPTTGLLPQAMAGRFGEWKEDKIDFTPQIPKYEVNIPVSDQKSGNVKIYDNIYLDDNEVAKLNENGFVINIDRSSNEYFELYESNRYEEQANFITTDSILHTYHLFFNYLLESLEEQALYEAALKLSSDMLNVSQKQYESLKGTDLEGAALRNVAYFAVAEKLLDPDAAIPDNVKHMVEPELALIEAHQGIAESFIFGTPDDKLLEDYSQYIPRGHYTKSEKLKKYFNALMWYGRLTFRAKNRDETYSALLIVSALKNNDDLFENWDRLFEPINFFVGEPDDLTFYQYQQAANEVYGGELTTEIISDNPGKIAELSELIEKMPNPKINSMPIFERSIEPDREEAIKGFRFLGQRSTVDAMIFQKLIYRDTDENPKGEQRMLPKGLDIPAAFGSNLALKQLEKEGDLNYKNYPENMLKMRTFISQLPIEQWSSNLYWGWMYTLKALIDEYGDGYPAFMQNEAWKKKELITFLGSWTELKHDTILYAKQVYAELGGGPGGAEVDDRGYVEPNPVLYNRLKSLIGLTIDGLERRDLLDSANKENLSRLQTITEKLRDISIKELQQTPLTEDDYEFIRSYGGQLEHFFSETLSASDRDKPMRELMDAHPTAIVADVATDPNGFVLEEATGLVSAIYVVFPIDGELHIAKGGVFSHYEFPWPMNDRLTDEKWRQILFPWDNFDYTNAAEPQIIFEPEIASWQKDITVTY